ncbi:hypothetical protein VSDG_04772 [Cytospora chrysosperma]|uniref:FAD-binding domain-containing protein n=1 Tax=Cytospora chrysosperma TaxID=252740 RepID=A0A423W1M2_CYTCH|nr:hypothetical protein VSDG_04772 [Valsa sordida]
MQPPPSVLIVGAGPVGLTTALALQQAGVPGSAILVADQRPTRALTSVGSKALSASASTLEVFRALGAADELVAAGLPNGRAHFGAGRRLLDLGYDVLGTRYPFNMLVPQARTEGILLRRCEEAGVRFAWGRRFVGLTQSADEVCATFRPGEGGGEEEDETVRASWLVGCDGTGSAVRKAVGIPFDGTRATQYGWLVDGHADEDAPAIMGVPSHEGGRAMIFSTGEGRTGRRLMGKVPASEVVAGQRPAPPDLETVRAWAVRNFGTHYNFRDVVWTSVLGDGMRVAASFRSGRVFVAGDAAHQLFPAGGQGMNTGLLDATNLAWKLAMVITGKTGAGREAVERVLDSYTKERLAAVKAVEHNIHMQTVSIWASNEREKAVSDFMEEALNEPALNKRWARRVCGFADPVEPYQLECAGLGQGEELVGTRLTYILDTDTDNVIKAAKNSTFVVGFMAKWAVAEEQRHSIEQAVHLGGYSDKIRLLENSLNATDPKWDGVAAVLIRPDLRVAWVAREGSDIKTTQENFTKVVGWWIGGK